MSENGRKVVELPSVVTVRQLATLVNASPIDIIKQLMSNGVMANINQQLDFDTAAIVAQELGYEARPEAAPVPEEEPEDKSQAPEWRRGIGAGGGGDGVTPPPGG